MFSLLSRLYFILNFFNYKTNAIHTYPVYGKLKCYCIVLYCIVMYCMSVRLALCSTTRTANGQGCGYLQFQRGLPRPPLELTRAAERLVTHNIIYDVMRA